MAERKGKEGRKGKGVMLLKLFIKKKKCLQLKMIEHCFEYS